MPTSEHMGRFLRPEYHQGLHDLFKTANKVFDPTQATKFYRLYTSDQLMAVDSLFLLEQLDLENDSNLIAEVHKLLPFSARFAGSGWIRPHDIRTSEREDILFFIHEMRGDLLSALQDARAKLSPTSHVLLSTVPEFESRVDVLVRNTERKIEALFADTAKIEALADLYKRVDEFVAPVSVPAGVSDDVDENTLSKRSLLSPRDFVAKRKEERVSLCKEAAELGIKNLFYSSMEYTRGKPCKHDAEEMEGCAWVTSNC